MTVSGVIPPFVTISKSGICHGKWLREDVGQRSINLHRRIDERERLVVEIRRQLIDDGRRDDDYNQYRLIVIVKSFRSFYSMT